MPLRADFRLELHDEATLQRFLDAALTILERTGAKYESDKALDVLGSHGAHISKGQARIPRDVVLDALSHVPRRFTLASRDGSCDLDIGSGDTYYGPDGCGSEVVDWRTGERRHSTEADLVSISRLIDYLGSFQFWWPCVGASDCGETAQLHEVHVGWSNTVKHVQGMVNGIRQAQYAVEMAAILAGGHKELRRRPPFSNLTTVVTPLLNDRDGTDASLIFAEAGVPVVFDSTPALGTTAPATKAGAYVLGLADVLSAIVPVQLSTPGAPVVGAITPVYADPRTGAVVTAPLNNSGLLLATELLHFVGLPSLRSFGGTDADDAGSWQAGVETLGSLMFAPLDGCELCVGLGLTHSYRLSTVEKLMLDSDLYNRVSHAFRDIPSDDEALAVDVIESVGPGGHFLAQSHTRKNMPYSMVRAVTHEPEASIPLQRSRSKWQQNVLTPFSRTTIRSR